MYALVRKADSEAKLSSDHFWPSSDIGLRDARTSRALGICLEQFGGIALTGLPKAKQNLA